MKTKRGSQVKKYKIIALSSFMTLSILAWSVRLMPEPSISDKNEYEKVLDQFGLDTRMAYYNVPGVSFAVIKNGELDWARGYGVLQVGLPEKINIETVFSVGSVSKIGTAVMILKLHESGDLDIDKDVNVFLKSWKVSENQYTKRQPVTLRHIMSHTAGLTVHGFADFNPDELLPTTAQILKGEPPAKNSPVYVNIPVGSSYRYSGGGTTIEQMIVEDLFAQLFHEVADDILFRSLAMERSSYENPLPESFGNIAKAHNRQGKTVALPRAYQSMPETAASGLWTTPSDFAKILIMVMKAYAGEHSYLSQSTVQDMMTPVKPSSYGLGPQIKEGADDIYFSHGGSNESYKARFIGSLGQQSGFIVFTNGARGSDLIGELVPVFESLLFKE